MPKRKQPTNQNLTIEEYLRGYDSVTLTGIINSFETSPAWGIFRAFLKLKQREFEVISLDLVRGNSTTQASAHASGVAQGLEDVADRYIQEFKNRLLGISPVVENTRPEEGN